MWRAVLVGWILVVLICVVVCADVLRGSLPEYDDLLRFEVEYTNIQPIQRQRRGIRYFEIVLEDGVVCRVDMGTGEKQAWYDRFMGCAKVGDQMVILVEAGESRLDAYEVRVNGQALLAYEDAVAEAKQRRRDALVLWGVVIPLTIPAVCLPALLKGGRKRR